MTTTENKLHVAQTILAQLGGRMFVMMTGAKDILGHAGDDASSPFVQFRIGRNAKGVSHVRVTLDPSDTYTVKFMKNSVRGSKTLAEISDIYAENLRNVFEMHTGLYTSL